MAAVSQGFGIPMLYSLRVCCFAGTFVHTRPVPVIAEVGLCRF